MGFCAVSIYKISTTNNNNSKLMEVYYVRKKYESCRIITYFPSYGI